MERLQLQRRVSQQPTKCQNCSKDHPFFMFVIVRAPQEKLICYNCLCNNDSFLMNIKCSYRKHNELLFSNIPTPDTQTAQNCLSALESMKAKAVETLQKVKTELKEIETAISEFYFRTKTLCESYISKISSLSDLSFEKILKNYDIVDQPSYIHNIKLKCRISDKIVDELNRLQQFELPSIGKIIKNEESEIRHIDIGTVPINCVTEVKGSLFFGLADGRIIYEDGFDLKEHSAHDSLIRSLVYDGRGTLYSGSDDFKIKAWDIRQGGMKCIGEFGKVPEGKSYHRDLVVFNAGKTMASTRGQFDGFKIRLWELKEYRNTKELEGHSDYIRGMTLNSSEEPITVSDDRSLRVWDTKTCKCKNAYYHGKKILGVHFSGLRRLICLIDEQNKALVLDENSLQSIQGWSVGRKVLCSHGSENLYFGVNDNVLVYSWFGAMLSRISLGRNFLPTSMLQLRDRLVVCDGKGKAVITPVSVKGEVK